MIFSLPEQGQVVRVRGRMYTVTEVQASALPERFGRDADHLVNLASVEDDALGESLQVIWENEVGTEILERAELPAPDGIDDPPRLDAFLDAVRWGAASQADRAALQAPFRSGIELNDYQLNPLVRALQMPRASLLIADDVGLGKTIEAGLIIQEMIARNRARTALIVCPSGLQFHWRDQMREKFGLEFRIIDSETMRALRRTRGIHANPWAHFPRLITSIDFIKRERPARLFTECVQGKPPYPRPFDILVVDEAHNVAPAGRGKYALDSQRTQIIRQIIPSFEHHLFLSATPHNGFQESFTALLELLDNQRFARGITPDPRQLDLVMVRRLKRDLRDEFGRERFPLRQLKVLQVDYGEEERQAHRWLNEYTRLRTQRARADETRYATEFVLKLLKKRMLSSPEAFRTTLEQHLHSLTTPREQPAETGFQRMGILRRQIAQVEEAYADDLEYEIASEGAVAAAGSAFTPPGEDEMRLLKAMQTWAGRASAAPDSKTQALLDWLRVTLKPGGTWNDERVILFTEYRTTQIWLQRILFMAGMGDADRLRLIYGGMDSEEREQIKNAFQAAPGPNNKVRILLATDAASEGIDLQKYCHRLVHVEIPWNPNRMEQRNGRIDRMGQRFPPEIYHFAPRGYASVGDEIEQGVPVGELEGDLEFLMRAAEKVQQIREDLMGKVGDVIAEQVEEAMLGARRRLDLDQVNAATRPARALMKLERQLDEQIRRQIKAFYDQRFALRLTPEHVQKVVEVGLNLSGQPALQPAASKPGAFAVPSLNGTWNLAKEGLAHPFTGEERPIVFDAKLAKADDVVLAHLNHPLVLMAQRLLRAEVWSPQRRLHRVTARIVPAHALEAPAVAAHARLLIVGGGRYRLHEELIAAGGLLTFGGRATFRRMKVSELDKALESAYDSPPPERQIAPFREHWDAIKAPLLAALEARTSDRIETLKAQLRERAEKEARDVGDILGELADAIRRQLDAPENRQMYLPGFSPAERDQYQRDIDALRDRLERIPVEAVQEQEAIARRYAELHERLFPVAVTFLLPEQYA